MAAKYYCDNCGEELTDADHERLRLRLGGVTVEVIHAFQNTWNGGHVCHACIKNVVVKGEPASAGCSYVNRRVE